MLRLISESVSRPTLARIFCQHLFQLFAHLSLSAIHMARLLRLQAWLEGHHIWMLDMRLRLIGFCANLSVFLFLELLNVVGGLSLRLIVMFRLGGDLVVPCTLGIASLSARATMA
jgi:hypothetical protein